MIVRQWNNFKPTYSWLESTALGAAVVTVSIENYAVARYLTSLDACALQTHVPLLSSILPISAAFTINCILFFAGFALMCGIARASFTCATTVLLFSLLCIDQRLYSNHLHLLTWLTAFYGLRTACPSQDSLYRVATLVQLVVMYCLTAIGKINPYFLSGGVLNAYWTDSGPLALPAKFRTIEFLSPLSALAIMAEIALAFMLISKRYRVAAIMVGAVFHLSLTLTARPIVTLGVASFSLAVLSGYAAVLATCRTVK